MPHPALNSSTRAELRAIKWFTLTHALGLVLFAGLLAGFFWYLHVVEENQTRHALYRDIDWAQQSIRLKLRENRDEVMASAADWSLSEQTPEARPMLLEFLARNPHVAYLSRIDNERRVAWTLPAHGVLDVVNRAPAHRVEDSAGYGGFHAARDSRRPAYTEPFLGEDAALIFELHVPVVREGAFLGVIVVGYSLQRVLTLALSPEIRERYQIAINDPGGNLLVSSSPRAVHEAALRYELPLDPPGHGMRLSAQAFESRPLLVERALLMAVVALALASITSLALMWRHARRRLAAEGERDRLFRLSLDLMCVMDEAGRFARVNPAFEEMFGEGSRGSLVDLAHPEDRGLVRAALAQAGDARVRPASFEARFACTDGWRWLHWSVRGDPEQHGVPSLYAIAHDVTERRDAETALAAETAFRQAMEDSMLTGMRAFDMQGRITYVNRAFCAMTGFSAEELVAALPPYPYWPDDAQEQSAAHLAMILRGDAPASGFEVRVSRKDGTQFDARMYVSPLVDRDGRQTGWMTSMTDITEPKRAREELAAAHERFTTVLDELEAAVWVLPLQTDAPAAATRAPLFTNRMFRQLFGETGGVDPVLLGADPEPGGALPLEVHHTGLNRWFEVRARQIRWVDGSPVRVLFATDVTRRHEAEERHRQQDEKLQRTSRLVTMGEMASSLAHELNQPLTAIANYCMGLSARIRSRAAAGLPVDTDEMLEMLRKASAQAERAGMVIRRIRDFVKRSEPERRPCRVETIVADAVGLADIDAQRQGVNIDVRIEPGLPSLHADPILIEQVLLNLLKNGIEAMRGAPRRRLGLAVVRRGPNVEFAVTDAGAGLAPEVHEKLFEPFFTTKAEGMGMGLNICRSIVESHQGRLWAETNETGGCTFRFTVPLEQPATIARAA